MEASCRIDETKGDPALFQTLGQRLSLQVFHHQEVNAVRRPMS